jgi:hypothetical protein
MRLVSEGAIRPTQGVRDPLERLTIREKSGRFLAVSETRRARIDGLQRSSPHCSSSICGFSGQSMVVRSCGAAGRMQVAIKAASPCISHD